MEFGFECSQVSSLPDKCIDILPPDAKIQVKGGPTLEISFNEKVKISSRNSIKFEILNLSPDCSVAWNHSINELNINNQNVDYNYSDIFPQVIVRNIKTKVNLKCSLKGSEQYVVTFFSSEKPITDLANNNLTTKVLIANAIRYLYISESEKQVIASSGEAFSASGLITLGLTVGIIMFQSIAISSFWVFVDLVQLVTYLPLLNCEIPENLRIFLSNYLAMGKVTIPWNLMPDFVPQIKTYIIGFLMKPFNENWRLAGFESISFLYNFLIN